MMSIMVMVTMIMPVVRLIQAEIRRFVNQKKLHLSAALHCLLQYHYHGEEEDRGGSDYDHNCHLLNMEQRNYDSKQLSLMIIFQLQEIPYPRLLVMRLLIVK